MKKNYRKGIMKIDTLEDEVAKYSKECLDEISLIPHFESDGEKSDNISSAENDGVKSNETEN